MDTVLVVGATSKAGRPLVRLLIGAGVPVRAAGRRPGALRAELGDCGVARLDFDDPRTFGPALEGIERVFLLAAPLDTQAAQRLEPLVEEACECGVERIVLLSSMSVARHPDSTLGQLEELVIETGVSAVVLRAGWYQENFAAGPLVRSLLEEGRLRVPAGAGRASFVSAEDVAEVAARALVDDDLADTIQTLTGPDALSHDDVAAQLSGAAGRPIEYEPADEQDLFESPLVAGRTVDQARYLARLYADLRDGVYEPVSDDVEAALGRAPAGFASFARRNAAVWR